MKLAVHFGAGKIGQGLIGDLLHSSGYEIVFADVMQAPIDQINSDNQYILFLIDHNYEERVVDHISALSTLTQEDMIIRKICDAQVVTTSVMTTNLPKIAPLLAKSLKLRLSDGKEGKIIVMACENAIMGTDILKKAMIDTGIITLEELDKVGSYPNTVVDRMVFSGTHNGKSGIEIGDALELAIERDKLPNPNEKPIKGAEYVDNIGMYLRRKIYMVNCGHAIASYLGYLAGYDLMIDVLNDPTILNDVTKAVMESAAALEKKYGFKHDDLERYMNNMLIRRFTTPGLTDTIARVGREPVRKLSANDRIMGPAYECEKYGLKNRHLLKGAAAAFKYKNSKDEQAVEIQSFIKNHGIKKAITKYTGAEPQSRIFKVILEEYNKLS